MLSVLCCWGVRGLGRFPISRRGGLEWRLCVLYDPNVVIKWRMLFPKRTLLASFPDTCYPRNMQFRGGSRRAHTKNSELNSRAH